MAGRLVCSAFFWAAALVWRPMPTQPTFEVRKNCTDLCCAFLSHIKGRSARRYSRSGLMAGGRSGIDPRRNAPASCASRAKSCAKAMRHGEDRPAMSIKGKAYIVGIYEHPTRLATDKTIPQLHAESARGALEDAGLTKNDIDGYFCAAGDTPGLGALSMIDYLGLKLKHIDSTDVGGSSYLLQVGHVAEAIAAGKCSIALITLAGRPRAEGMATGTAPRAPERPMPESGFELPYAPATANMYGMAAMRHMHEYGTTSEQLAWIKVAPSHHSQHNPHAMLRDVVTVEDVVNSPMISDPLHRLDCCVITDGGGAIVVVAPEIARSLKRPKVKLAGASEFVKTQMGGKVDLTYSGARFTGPAAFAEAGVKPSDMKYVSIYDSLPSPCLWRLKTRGSP